MQIETTKLYRMPDLDEVVRVALFPRPQQFKPRKLSQPIKLRVQLPSGDIVDGATLLESPLESDEEFADRVKDWEPTASIMLRVQLVTDGEVRKYRRTLRKIEHEERARLRALRENTTEDTHPELWDPSFSTEAGEEALEQSIVAWLRLVLRGIDGIELGAGSALKSTAQIEDVEVLIRVLQRHGWHHRAAARALEVQRLTGVQHLS